jgi:hypothetical protein
VARWTALLLAAVVSAPSAVAAPPPRAKAKASAAAPVIPAAQAPEVKLYDAATFLLPTSARVSVRWVLPPTKESRSDVRLAVDPTGAPLLGIDDRLVSPVREWVVSLGTAPAAMAYLPGGGLMLAVGSDLGLLANPDADVAADKGVPRVAFQPVVACPLRRIEALAAVGDDLLCAGLDAARGKYAVYQLRVEKGIGPRELELVHQSTDAITALAGDETALYVATGQTVSRISRQDGAVSVYYVHPSAPVRALALTPAGLVVSTDYELVLASPSGALELLRSTGHRIAAQRGTLYVLFQQSLGVVAIDGLGDLARYDQAVRPAQRGETRPALALAPLRFFESGPTPPPREAYADRFEGKSVRQIIARIDYRAPPARAARRHAVTVSWYEPKGGRLSSATYPVVLGPRAMAGTIRAAIGQGPNPTGYRPPYQASDGIGYAVGPDALGARYPGLYRVEVDVDGVPALAGSFTFDGEPSPEEVLIYDDLPKLKALLASGLSARAKRGNLTLLDEAVRFGSTGAVEAVLDAGADPNEPDAEGNPPLATCLFAGGWRAKAELLLRRGANVNGRVGTNKEPLAHSMIWAPDKVAFLVRNGADPRARSAITGDSLLAAAASHGGCNEELVGELVGRGVDVNEAATSGRKETALGMAIFLGNEPCVTALLAKGASQRAVHGAPEPHSALYVALERLREIRKPALRRIARLLLDDARARGAGPENVPLEPGERWIMFEDDNAALFDPAALALAVLADDDALKRASKSSSPEVQALALRAHLSRARQETGAATSEEALRAAHGHCLEAMRLAEARFQTLEVEVVPVRQPSAGTDGPPAIGLVVFSRPEGGAYVLGAVPGGAAAAAGLAPGDVLLSVGGAEVKTPLDVVLAVSHGAPGEPVKLRFLREAPAHLPELPLTCGALEQRLGLRELAQMNLRRWLAGNPNAEPAPAVRALLEGK